MIREVPPPKKKKVFEQWVGDRGGGGGCTPIALKELSSEICWLHCGARLPKPTSDD